MAYTHFDRARKDPRLWGAWPLRSAQEIAGYKKIGGPVGTAFYGLPSRANFDGLVQSIDPTAVGAVGSWNDPQQVEIPMKISAGTTFLQSWDHFMSEGWRWKPDKVRDPRWPDEDRIYAPNTKSLRWGVAGKEPVPAAHWLAAKHYFSHGLVPGEKGTRPELATFLFNSQSHTFTLPPTVHGTDEVMRPQVFNRIQSQIVRTWVHYSAAGRQLSAWQTRPDGTVLQMLDRVAWGFPQLGIVHFGFSFDTSKDRVPWLNSYSYIGHRNVYVIRDIEYTEVVASWLTTDGMQP